MKKFVLLSLLVLLAVPAVQAVPTLQLYIDGATYDNATETWISSANSFDLYVIGQGDLNDVYLSMALEGVMESQDPSAANVDIDGTGYPTSTWTYGYAPLSNDPAVWNGGSQDLSKHGVYPAWYTEFGLGSFTAQGGIGDADGFSGWLPSSGYISSNTQGWIQKYNISLSGGYAVHFDAYTKNSDGTIDQFAPFSHDAQGGGTEVPEPATMLLFGMGLAGVGVVRKFRKK